MQIFTTKEVSTYLNINEKRIYQLVKDREIPHTRVGGKLVFAKEIIDRWIYKNTEQSNNILISGSDDVLFREIINHYNKDSDDKVYFATVGSTNGLKLLNKKKATMSCAHIADQQGEYSLSYLDRYLNKTDYVVLRLFTRKQVIYLQHSNPHSVKNFADIFTKKLRFANRSKGSGTRILIDQLMKKNNINAKSDSESIPEAQSHIGAAMKVLSGEADASFGIQHVSDMLGLTFLPLAEEPFDLVIQSDYWESKVIKPFIDLLDQTSLPNHLQNLSGYDISCIGNVIWLPDSLKF